MQNSTQNMQCFSTGASSLLPPAEHAINDPPLPLEQRTPPPHTNLPYADQYVTPAHAPRLPGAGASGQVPPLCFDSSPEAIPGGQVDRSADATVRKRSGLGPSRAAPWQSTTHQVLVEMPAVQQSLKAYPVASPYPAQPIRPGPQVYASYSCPPSVPTPSLQSPPVADITVKQVAAGQALQVHSPEATFLATQVPGYSGATLSTPSASAWVPNITLHSSQAVLDQAATDAPPDLSPQQTQILASHPNMHADALARAAPPPTSASQSAHPHMTQFRPPAQAVTNQCLPMASYGGFMQTHQVKNVQVFTGNPDCKILVEDWIRDMQYLLEAIELPMHLRFSTVVRHLGGEARNLILNLYPHDQTPEKAFEELRAEYSDTRGSLDPLADFYERTQNSGESACSYAISLEAKLRTVEEKQRGGRPFLDRDSKLTRQFMRGLTDEEVYRRIAPMAPRLLSFRELQAELRNLARETKKFQTQSKTNKSYAQVHVTSGGGGNTKTDRSKHISELTELTEMVKKLAHIQEEQMAKLSQLEMRMASPPLASPLPVQPAKGKVSQSPSFVCYRCGEPGHTARVCRAVLPEPSLAEAQQPKTPADGHMYSAQHLNA
ncbi:hypothetical protein M9458_045163 [Cirrhinus mrigala]|uniref:CCHC-type domain-containing protein n=1 Tax=Cirrhinus mrigala TaxID=683832 RepID=A0ABD0NHG6_CIRMR